jgi:preprotein translocase subunit SecG
MFEFILIVQTLVAAAMVSVILMQRSEGGGLAGGGSPSGMMSARGASDFLTRATAVLATLFVLLSIVLAGLATVERQPLTIDPGVARQAPAPATGAAPFLDPLAGTADQTVPGNEVAPAGPPQENGAVPIAQ